MRRVSARTTIGLGSIVATGARCMTEGEAGKSPMTGQSSDKVVVNKDRPKSIAEAGDGPIPLDFKPGKGTDIIDHHMDLAERFYEPVTVVPLERVLEHEKKREHLRIYRDKPEKEMQLWEGGMPRFVRAPMHMLNTPMDSRNHEIPIGPVLHDTRTGVAIRIISQMIPSPEMVVKEDALRNKVGIFFFRFWVWGYLFVFGFMVKFTSYMALRTKLRSQGIANPILPQNRVKVLEIIWFARQDFKQYKKLFNEFSTTHWMPYRQSRLREEAQLAEAAAKEVMEAVDAKHNVNKDKTVWESFTSIFTPPAEELDTIQDIYVPELKKTFKVDTSKTMIGMSPDGPVYAPPDTEMLFPEQLNQKLKKLREKTMSQMDEDTKEWSQTSYNKRGREQSNEFIVQFHIFLNDKGVIKPLDPQMIDKMYDLQSVPRIQDIGNAEDGTGASEGLATRPQLVRVK